ncbi:MAG TPA: AAA family ATPase [Acidimicrobiales bacterium]|nr:AAA family ATPase [Acidimicrobiales bacterium]
MADPTSGCAQCGAGLGPGSKFCSSCGAPVAPPAARVEGERRHLAVMFCDLVGSTTISEQLDPEDYGDIVLAYQEAGRAIVERLGGSVAQFAGDGLLSSFGFPVAHEDDADRAVMAGLAILDALDDINARARRMGTTFEARVGVHVGPTVIGAMGAAHRTDISIFGITTNVAARLEAFAQPGTVVVSDAVVRGLRRRYRLTDLGVPELKGVTRRVNAFRVDGVEGGRTAQLDPPAGQMVGRSAELGLLLGAYARARAGCHVVVVSGEPGVGKSTLVGSLAAELAGEEHLWVEFQCSELAEASPLWPVIGGLRNILEIGDHDPPDLQRKKLRDGIVAPLDHELDGFPFLADLLGVEPDDRGALLGVSAEVRRARTLDALTEWALALAARAPIVLVAEDLHWADPTTLELIERIISRATNLPVLCLCTSRDGVPQDWDAARVEHVSVDRLGKAESRALAARLSETYDVPADTLVALADRADGVPLFIEELVRSAAESHAEAEAGPAGLPDTLQKVLTARLDRLGDSRALAQAASVIGREFSLELLGTVVGQTPERLTALLGDLVEAGILQEQPHRHPVTYAFRHALIQDAAYATMLRRRRRELHGVAAAALSEKFPVVADAAPELVAHHLTEADRPLDAARWYAQAGRHAVERAALPEAISHYETAIALLRQRGDEEGVDELLLTLLILCGNAYMGTSGPGGDETLPLWEGAIELAQRLENSDELSSAMNGAAVYWSDRGELDTTIALASRILEIGERGGSRVASLRGHLSLGMAYLYAGEVDRSIVHCEQGLALEREGDYEAVTYGVGHDQGTMGRMVLSWSQWWSGRPDAALATALEGDERARRLPSSLSQAMAGHAVGFAHYMRDEHEQAIQVARSNLMLTEELHFPFWLGLALLVLGASRAHLGDRGGLDDLDRAFGILMAMGNRGGGTMGISLLAESQRVLGFFEEAEATAAFGLGISADNGQHFYDPELRRIGALAAYQADPGRSDEALRRLASSHDEATRAGARSFALQCAVDLARLRREDPAGRPAAAGDLEAALAAMVDGHGTHRHRQARLLLHELSTSGTVPT